VTLPSIGSHRLLKAAKADSKATLGLCIRVHLGFFAIRKVGLMIAREGVGQLDVNFYAQRRSRSFTIGYKSSIVLYVAKS
jgi:hypothetical protein